MREQILTEIKRLEQDENLRVLFACESGSRAWGFASPDSDYDVRFIYAKPLDWYLTVSPGRDVCERMLPNDLDFSGWELRKTLQLFMTCNVALYEWLGSPIVYVESEFGRCFREMIPLCFNPRKATFHYLSMATNSAGDEMPAEIKIKKLFYTLRPILACLWIRDKHTMPPTSFHDIIPKVELPDTIRALIASYLKRKETAAEGEVVEIDALLRDWGNTQFNELRKSAETIPVAPAFDPKSFDELLRSTVTDER